MARSDDDSTTPDRAERQKCWTARDAYFRCLDTAGVPVPGQEPKGVCSREQASYLADCQQSWVRRDQARAS